MKSKRRNWRLFIPCIVIAASCKTTVKDPYQNWEVYGGTKDALHYSSLTGIDTGNVGNLRVQWVYHTGDVDTVSHSQIQCNPVIIDGTMYAVTPKMRLFAADAANGKPLWVFDPRIAFAADTNSTPKLATAFSNTGRGVTYWTDLKDDKRIFFTAGPFLICVNATTGKIISSF